MGASSGSRPWVSRPRLLGLKTCGASSCQTHPPCSPKLEFVLLNGKLAWNVALSPALANGLVRIEPLDPLMMNLSGHDALLLGASGVGVTWGGDTADSTVQDPVVPDYLIPVGAVPQQATQGPALAYAVFAGENRVDTAHPPEVLESQVGQPITLTVSAIMAAGRAIPSSKASP